MIAIYQNEALLLEDKLKEHIKKVYKNVRVTFQNEIINDFLISISVNVYDIILNIDNDFYVETKDLITTNDLYLEIQNKIVTSLSNIMKKHYMRNTT